MPFLWTENMKIVMTRIDEIVTLASRGVIGINEDLEISAGYDNEIPEAYVTPPDWLDEDSKEFYELSRSEKLQLADRMIDIWISYRNRCLDKKGD
jgi:hypothetical protein